MLANKSSWSKSNYRFLKYLHLCDEIIVMNRGEMIEYGTFPILLAKNGFMTKLLSENVRMSTEDKIQENDGSKPGMDRDQPSLLRSIEKSRLSIVSASGSIDVVVPNDAEPMKLVLEDQSVNYKVWPSLIYLRAGWGVIISLLIYAFFFLVYIFRILSGD